MLDRRHAAKYPELVYTLESTGAQLSLDNALPYLYQLHQATRECQSYDLGPVFEARLHVTDEENTGVYFGSDDFTVSDVMLGGGGGWADAAVPLPPEPAARLQGAAHPDRNLPTQGLPHA